MTYELSIVYTPNSFKVSVGTTNIEIKEDLFKRFQGWAYFGVSSFFRGLKRNVDISKYSFICEDDYTAQLYYKWLVNGQFVENTSIQIPAGSAGQLAIKYMDIYKNFIPHFSGLGILNTNLKIIDLTGKATLTDVLQASDDGYTLTTNIKPSTVAGASYQFELNTSKGSAYARFSVTPSDFTNITVEQAVIKDGDKYYISPKEYSWDSVSTKKVITISVITKDAYDNVKDL
jgi:hypothetical protein